jgi:prepilin signal peptidase PulO-like enzyme (type II secretory pathway)
MCVVFFLAVVTGALTALALLALRSRKTARSEGPHIVAFGTFLAIAGIYYSFFGDVTVQWYLKFFH